MMQSTNPALSNDDVWTQYYGTESPAERSDVTTLSGVVNKTGLLTCIAVVTGGVGYVVAQSFPSIVWISAIVSFVVSIGVFFKIRGNPQHAPIVAPIYAVAQGFFLGAFTCLADRILEAQNLKVAGGVGLQAFIITASALVSMLLLYRAKIIRPSRTLQAILATATGAIMLAYLVSFVLSFFGMSLPLISAVSAARDQGAMGLLGLGINVLILVVASLWLVFDFKLIEDKIAAGAPRYMEWYCGFGLIVSLAWIYFEAVKLVLRLALLFGNRD